MKLRITTIDPGDGIYTNEEVTHLDYTKTEHNETAAPQLDPSVLKGIGIYLQGINQRISEDDPDNSLPELEYIPEAKYEEPEEVKPDLQHILTETNETNEEYIEDIKNIKDEITTEFEEIFVKTEPSQAEDPLIQEMPEIFEDGEFDDTEFVQQYIPEFRSDQNRIDLDVRARTTHALVPTDVKIDEDYNPLTDPNVTTILPPIEPKIEPKIEFSPTVAAITPYQSNEEDIDFRIDVKREDGTYSPISVDEPDATPIEIDEDKFVVTEDGDVILTESDNIQVDYKPIVPYSERVVQLPPEVEMDKVKTKNLKTKNLVLKRKQP